MSLLALLSLGAHLRASSPGQLARALPQVRFALARGTQDVDRLLAHAPGGISAIVVENEFGTEPSPSVRVVSWQELLQSGPGGEALVQPHQDALALVSESPGGVPVEWTLSALKGAAPSGTARQAVADFDIGWVPGVRWLLNDWLLTGAQLVLTPPGAAAGPSPARSPADLWLVSSEVLNAVASRVHQRAAVGGAGSWALGIPRTHRWLGGLAHLLRSRIRRVLGWAPGLTVFSDAGASPQALQLIQCLGLNLSVVPSTAPAQATASVHHLSRPQARNDRREPLLTQVSP